MQHWTGLRMYIEEYTYRISSSLSSAPSTYSYVILDIETSPDMHVFDGHLCVECDVYRNEQIFSTNSTVSLMDIFAILG